MNDNNLAGFYQHVREKGQLRTDEHAQVWTDAVLASLGQQLDRGTKKTLARALPEELAQSLTRVFWLVHFRNKNLSSTDFQNQVARRAGNSDTRFARLPILGVFGSLQLQIAENLDQRVSESLAPEIRELWQQAD